MSEDDIAFDFVDDSDSEIAFEFIDEEILVKQKYGFLPTSVWNLTYDNRYKELEIEGKGIKRTSMIKRIENYPFSMFNPSVAERVIKYWSNKGDTILDPFMGYGMRGFVARALGRNYIGYEISPKTYQQVKCKLEQTSILDKSVSIKIILGNGCYLNEIYDESVDMVFTCPPYWDIEKYEKVPGQLSECKSYEVFLEFINICLSNCYRVLKKGKI